MNRFLTIAAAALIAGAAPMASATDHKSQKRHVPAPTDSAKSAVTVTANRALVHKTKHVRHHLKKHKGHHSRHHGKK